MKKLLIFLAVLTLSCATQTQDNNTNLTLDRLIQEVIKQNGDAVKEYIQVSISKEQIAYEKGIYDPIFTSNLMRQSTNIPNSVENELVRFQETYQGRVDYFDNKVSGLTSWGGIWSVVASHNRKESSLIKQNKSYDREYDATVKLQLEQPLLRNSGTDATEAKITLAQYEEEINLNLYKQKLMELQGLTIQLYWKYYGAKKICESWEKSLALAQKDYQTLEMMAKSGKIANTEVLEAQTAINFRKSEYENAKTKLFEVKNQLLTLLNIEYSNGQNLNFVLENEPNNELSSTNLPQDYVNSALEKWPELMNAKRNIQKAQLQKKYALNQTLPELNLLTDVEKTALQSDRKDALDKALGSQFVSWSVGVKLTVPINNDQAKSNYRIATLRLIQAQSDMATLKNNLINSIMTKIDNVKSSKTQYQLYKENLGIQEYLLQVERDKLMLGKANVKQLLQKEEDYMNDQRKYLSSIIGWKTSEALLEITAGNLLSKYNIEIDTLYNRGNDPLQKEYDYEDPKMEDIRNIFLRD